ncbi:hypothetical protein NDU88_006188 [Pleurodeles waltl]|uniref:CCHC-type domain-containing protein n=1 Tax=Pleurodeles waltl TaxID=8319 RepID=A0AAV7UNW9_PLEWA|nr:hypothetical protein NDU88_006188 [Pleurodeles waltl]
MSQPPPFLTDKGDPILPWKRWKNLFDSYLIAIGGEKFSPARKQAVLLQNLGIEGRNIYDSLETLSIGGAEGEPRHCYEMSVAILTKNPDLREAIAIVEGMESANSWIKEMNGHGENDLCMVQAPHLRKEVLRGSSDSDSKTPGITQERKKEPRLQRYFRCGNTGHTANSPNCFTRNSQCRKCGKKGHYVRVCKSDKSNIDAVTENVNKMILCIDSDTNNIVNDSGMVDVGPVTMPECAIKLHGKIVTVLADSGSPYTMVGGKNYQAIFGEDFHSLTVPDINTVSYGGSKIEVIGYKIMRIQFQMHWGVDQEEWPRPASTGRGGAQTDPLLARSLPSSVPHTFCAAASDGA